MKTLICPCGKTVTHNIPKGRTIGDICKKTGFNAVFTYGCGIIYLCPKCWLDATRLAKELVKLIGSDSFSFYSLVDKKEYIRNEL